MVDVPSRVEFDALTARVVVLENASHPTVPAPPPQAAGMVYVFGDDFTGTTLDLTKWGRGLWYEADPGPAPFVVANGVLTITNSTIVTAPNRDLTKAFAPRGGYTEMLAKPSRSWAGFWDMSVNHMQGVPKTADPTTWCSEIDGLETDSAHPTVAYYALHLNTGSSGVPPAPVDQWNHGLQNNVHDLGVDLTAAFHKYGRYWDQNTVSYYFDDKLIFTQPSYPSTWQRMLGILDAWPGGVANGPVMQPITLQVEHYYAWQVAGSLK